MNGVAVLIMAGFLACGGLGAEAPAIVKQEDNSLTIEQQFEAVGEQLGGQILRKAAEQVLTDYENGEYENITSIDDALAEAVDK